jgi:hypothetical protein
MRASLLRHVCVRPTRPDLVQTAPEVQARIKLARQIGAAGDPHEARLLAEMAPADAHAHFGAVHWVTLSARFETAVWLRDTDGPTAGIQAFSALVDEVRMLGAEHEWLVVAANWNLGGAVLETGDAQRAAEIRSAAVQAGGRIYGVDHVIVLEMRLTHLTAVDAAGRLDDAVELAEQLSKDCERVLGANNQTSAEARELEHDLRTRRT